MSRQPSAVLTGASARKPLRQIYAAVIVGHCHGSRNARPSREPAAYACTTSSSDLVADGLVSKEAADLLARNRRHARSDIHPLIVIADQKWKDPRNPRKLLHLEALTQWLAEREGLPYLHIDPFKIDFAAVTKVMSNAYAQRYKILPVAINSTGSDDRRLRAAHARVGRRARAMCFASISSASSPIRSTSRAT